jgi:polyribonucleotide nucleotidyltransferase
LTSRSAEPPAASPRSRWTSRSRACRRTSWPPPWSRREVEPDQIRLVIGPGGKTIKGIVDQTGVTIDVEGDGKVNVASSDPDAAQRALDIIKGLTQEPEVNAICKGTAQRIVDFGALIQILPNIDGLLHISETAHQRIERVEDVLHEGDTVDVKVRLSRKELLPLPEGMEARPREERPERRPPED